MKTKSYIFAGIIAVITMGNAMATDENTVTSKSYVDAQDDLKQDLIDAAMIEIPFGKGTTNLPALVSYDTTDGLTGTKYGILNNSIEYYAAIDSGEPILPTLSVVDTRLGMKQNKIPKSGYDVNGNAYTDDLYLNDTIKGTGLVTRTSTDGVVGERKIFEASDLSGYSALTGSNRSIADISIPTVGAMMNAISSGVSAAAPTGTPNTIANYNEKGDLGSGIATYDASGTYTAQNDAGKIATAAAVETKQNKIPATGTNASTPGDTVVTYTSTAGTIGERGIYDGTGTMGSDDLITAGAVQGQISGINTSITNINNNIDDATYNITSQTLESIEIQKLTCANPCREGKNCAEGTYCTLWQIADVGTAHKLTSCTTANDCPSCDTGFAKLCLGDGTTNFCHCVYGACSTANDCPACTAGTTKACTNNRCECQLKANGQSCTSSVECQSGFCADDGVDDIVEVRPGGSGRCHNR